MNRDDPNFDFETYFNDLTEKEQEQNLCELYTIIDDADWKSIHVSEVTAMQLRDHEKHSSSANNEAQIVSSESSAVHSKILAFVVSCMRLYPGEYIGENAQTLNFLVVLKNTDSADVWEECANVIGDTGVYVSLTIISADRLISYWKKTECYDPELVALFNKPFHECTKEDLEAHKRHKEGKERLCSLTTDNYKWPVSAGTYPVGAAYAVEEESPFATSWHSVIYDCLSPTPDHADLEVKKFYANLVYAGAMLNSQKRVTYQIQELEQQVTREHILTTMGLLMTSLLYTTEIYTDMPTVFKYINTCNSKTCIYVDDEGDCPIKLISKNMHYRQRSTVRRRVYDRLIEEAKAEAEAEAEEATASTSSSTKKKKKHNKKKRPTQDGGSDCEDVTPLSFPESLLAKRKRAEGESCENINAQAIIDSPARNDLWLRPNLDSGWNHTVDYLFVKPSRHDIRLFTDPQMEIENTARSKNLPDDTLFRLYKATTLSEGGAKVDALRKLIQAFTARKITPHLILSVECSSLINETKKLYDTENVHCISKSLFEMLNFEPKERRVFLLITGCMSNSSSRTSLLQSMLKSSVPLHICWVCMSGTIEERCARLTSQWIYVLDSERDRRRKSAHHCVTYMKTSRDQYTTTARSLCTVGGGISEMFNYDEETPPAHLSKLVVGDEIYAYNIESSLKSRDHHYRCFSASLGSTLSALMLVYNKKVRTAFTASLDSRTARYYRDPDISLEINSLKADLDYISSLTVYKKKKKVSRKLTYNSNNNNKKRMSKKEITKGALISAELLNLLCECNEKEEELASDAHLYKSLKIYLSTADLAKLPYGRTRTSMMDDFSLLSGLQPRLNLDPLLLHFFITRVGGAREKLFSPPILESTTQDLIRLAVLVSSETPMDTSQGESFGSPRTMIPTACLLACYYGRYNKSFLRYDIDTAAAESSFFMATSNVVICYFGPKSRDYFLEYLATLEKKHTQSYQLTVPDYAQDAFQTYAENRSFLTYFHIDTVFSCTSISWELYSLSHIE